MYKRFFVFLFGIFCCGLGIAVSTQANLGTTPISSLPYVLTFILPLSFGTTTFIINMIFLLGQKLILGKDFKRKNYLQILVTLFFGLFVDFGMYISAPFRSDNYFYQIIMLIIGSAILAFGVELEVISDISYVPGEGIVKVIANKTKKEFGKVKLSFDISHCIIAILISCIFLHTIKGLREGTIIAAFLVGIFVCLYNRFLFGRGIFKKEQSKSGD